MNKLEKISKLFIPVAIFLLLTFIVNHAIVTGFSKNIETNDGRLLAWTLAWDNHKLLTDPLNIFQANIYYPNENTLTYSEHAIGISLLSMPAYILSGGNPIIGFNFVMLLSFFLNAFATYLLTKYFTKSQTAAIIAGVIYGFCSYKILNFGHLQNMVIFYMPLLLLLLYRYFDTKKLKYLIGVGLCLLLQSLSSWYHMVFIFLLFGIFCLFFIYQRKFTKKDYIRFLIMGLLILIAIVPFAIPYFKFNKEHKSAYNMNELKTYSADFGGYLLPSPNTFIGSEVLPYFKISKTSWSENFNFIGYVALALSLISFISVKRNKKDRFIFEIKFDKKKLIFVICGLIFMVLSFGPFLRLNDVTTRIPLPYYVIYNLLPPIRFIRAVSRFSTVVFLMIAILAGFGYQKLEKRINKNKLAALLLLVASVTLIMLEYYPFQDYRTYEDVSITPEVYTEVKNNDEIKTLVELPMDVGPFVTTGYIYWAGYHLKPIVNGYSGYQPENYNELVNLTTQFPDSISLAKLKELGVTNVIVNPGYEKKLSLTYLTLQKEAEGYKLFKIKDNINSASFYYDNFNTKLSQNFGEVAYSLHYTEISEASEFTPIGNIAPVTANIAGHFEVTTDELVSTLTLNFRTYSENDSITVICNEEQTYSFTNSPEAYLIDPISLDCNTKKIEFTLFSDKFKDRSMITMLALQ